MTQQEKLEKKKDYANFKESGNNSYQAKKDGVTITIHSNGNIQYQGSKNREKIEQEVKQILETENIDTASTDKQLFIVYGHDKIAKEQLEYILAKLDIKTNQVTNNTGMTIIEALESNISCVHAGVILLTPDDICIAKKDYEEHRDNIEGYIHVRARQNVVLEMGMIMAKLGRDKTIILAKGEVEIPSDIEGIFRLSFKEEPKEILKKLVERLESCGFVIDKNKVFEAM